LLFTAIQFVSISRSTRPLGTVVACVAPGTASPCNNGTAFATSGAAFGPTLSEGRVPNLNVGDTYECYAVTSNAIGGACSAPLTFTVSLPPTPHYTFTNFSNAAPILYNSATGVFSWVSGVPVQLGLLPCASWVSECTLNVNLTLAAVAMTNITRVIMSPFAYRVIPLQPFGIWRHPSGGDLIAYSSYMAGFTFVANLATQLHSGTPPDIFNISPEPALIFGMLRSPGTPSAPALGTITGFNTWTTSWTNPADTGSPASQVRLRYVIEGQASLNRTGAFEGNLVTPPVASSSVVSLTITRTYTCYVVAYHILGQVCSTGTQLVVP